MRTAFLKRTLPLIIAGIALGLLARAIFNVEPPNGSQRRFNRPIDSNLPDGDFGESPNIILDDLFDGGRE